jgi:sec-independent protein translocase protein TatA
VAGGTGNMRAPSLVVPRMGELQPMHWLLVIFVALLLFGGSRISQLGKGLGEGIRHFKEGLKGDDADDDAAASPPEK